MSDLPSHGKPQEPRRPFQFGLASMLLVMAMFSVLAAAWAGMLHRGSATASSPPGFFVLMAVAAPLGLLIVLSLLRAVLRRSKRRR